MFESYDQDIGMLTNNTNKKLIHYLNFKLEEFHLTTEQWAVLFQLSKQNKISQKQLAEVCGKDQSTLTRILDILERKSFIERHSSREDRRSFVIHITEDGVVLSKKVAPFLKNIFKKLLKNIPKEELKIFREVLLQINENLDDVE